MDSAEGDGGDGLLGVFGDKLRFGIIYYARTKSEIYNYYYNKRLIFLPARKQKKHPF